MNGVINVLKPPGMTSSDVVVFLRRELAIKKVGHTGTLDPEAAGVLPICLGKATRIADYIMDRTKIYRCGMKLGITTNTADSTGNITSRSDSIPSQDRILEVLKAFQGKQMQIPPMYSAIKINGQKLYELARKGIEVERKPREIMIWKNTMIAFYQPDLVLFETICSKGTYIRTLCKDMGDWLGCGGTMDYLIRKASGSFILENAHTLDEILTARDGHLLPSLIISAGQALEGILPSVFLKEETNVKISHGNSVEETSILKIENRTGDKDAEFYSVYCGNTFMGIGYFFHDGNQKNIKMKSVLI